MLSAAARKQASELENIKDIGDSLATTTGGLENILTEGCLKLQQRGKVMICGPGALEGVTKETESIDWTNLLEAVSVSSATHDMSQPGSSSLGHPKPTQPPPTSRCGGWFDSYACQTEFYEMMYVNAKLDVEHLPDIFEVAMPRPILSAKKDIRYSGCYSQTQYFCHCYVHQQPGSLVNLYGSVCEVIIACH
jgi:hypothetical protein